MKILNLEEILERNTLEYAFLPNYHIMRKDRETKEKAAVFTSYTGRLKYALSFEDKIPEYVGEVIVFTSDSGYNDTPKEYLNIPEGYKIEVREISFGKGYWSYFQFTVYKDDKFLFDLVRNYNTFEFSMISTECGDFLAFSEDYESFAIIDIRNMKIYGHCTYVCPWIIPTLEYDKETHTLHYSVEGVYWGIEWAPHLVSLSLDLSKPIEESTWLDTLEIKEKEQAEKDNIEENNLEGV